MAQTPREPDAELRANGPQTPSEDELRAAYAAELRRISASDLILQTAASLINVGAYRLGLVGGEEGERDLDQVRDAIDGVRGLLPILERRADARQLGPLRDALSQLQLAYAREAQAGAAGAADSADTASVRAGAEPRSTEAPVNEGAALAGERVHRNTEPSPDERRQGPAESSGRLWVPGKG